MMIITDAEIVTIARQTKRTEITIDLVGRRRVDAWRVRKSFDEVLSKAALPRTHFHTLRHSAASFLHAQGPSARDLMEMLGHTQISTTMNFYTHLFTEARRETARLMERGLEGLA